jgi:Bacterial Ig domain
MRVVGIGVMSLLLLARVASGQQATVPYFTGNLCWPWSPGPPPDKHGMAHHLNVTCGLGAGQPAVPVKAIPITSPPPDPPLYCVALTEVFPEPTSFPASRVCVATAAQGHAESEASPPFPFRCDGSSTCCRWDGSPDALTQPCAPSTDVIPPVVTIESPESGDIVPRKTALIITVNASDDLGTIRRVVVFVNRESICTLATPPFRCLWEVPAAPNRQYTLQATAADGADNVAMSALVRVTSGNPAALQESPAVAPKAKAAKPKKPAAPRTPSGAPAW